MIRQRYVVLLIGPESGRPLLLNELSHPAGDSDLTRARVFDTEDEAGEAASQNAVGQRRGYEVIPWRHGETSSRAAQVARAAHEVPLLRVTVELWVESSEMQQVGRDARQVYRAKLCLSDGTVLTTTSIAETVALRLADAGAPLLSRQDSFALRAWKEKRRA